MGEEITIKDCRKCKHMETFKSESGDIMRICECDIEDNEDGSFQLIEVTTFTPTDCIAFMEEV